MIIWDILAIVTGILGVILTIRQSIWCWLFDLISVAISIAVFYDKHLYGDMSLNIFYFVSGLYGWIFWSKKKHEPFVVSHITTKWAAILVLVTVLQTLLYYYLLKQFKSDQILLDAILTACSLTCTYMMIKKWIENWLLWALIDGSYIFLYLKKDMPIWGLLYAFFSLMAIYGYYSWKKQARHLL